MTDLFSSDEWDDLEPGLHRLVPQTDIERLHNQVLAKKIGKQIALRIFRRLMAQADTLETLLYWVGKIEEIESGDA